LFNRLLQSKKHSIFSKNPFVFYTQYALVQFFEESPRHQLTPWDQMVIFNRFQQFNKAKLPCFGRLIEATNEPSQLILLCKSIAYFEQYSALKSLYTLLLKSPPVVVKKEIIKTCGT